MTALINDSHRRRSAFTLAELPVVIGIIGILAALISPGIHVSLFRAASNNAEHEGFQTCLHVNELSLTQADDASDEIIFDIDDVQGDPTELFSYQNLCDHTSLYVVDRQAEDKLCRRLRLAEFLEEEDLLRPRDNVLTAQQRHLQRLSGKSLLPEAADELDILFEVRKGFGRAFE